MVKADLSRDYYGDLELQPGADAQEIKKQFKKLALAYHPDRNPGRESEVTAKFQKIQSAHEVLTDAAERAKYDSNRSRTASSFRQSTAYSGAGSSGVRGNPWANAGSQWAPPPKKAPTARKGAPPPSAGAQRYQKFDPPKETPNWAHNEGPEARAKTYEAWENMRGHGHTSTGSSKQWGQPPKVPPREPPQSGRTSASQNYATPPKARAAYTDFRHGTTSNASPRRSDSMNGRKGFMPNTPGGDEPAAPRGAYFTTTRAAAEPPPVPPRNPSPIPPPAPATNADADLLNQFRDSIPKYQPRTSTPYSTHGGEKFNPFESANIGRSKSTREPEHPRHVSRAAGSDPNLGSPHRTETFASRQAKGSNRSPVEISSDDDSNSSLENGPALSGRPFGRRRVSKNVRNGARPTAQPQQVPKAAESSPQTRKHLTNLDKFRQWMKENPGTEPPLNGFPPDGPPLRYDATQTDKPDEAKIFSFNVDGETFKRTEPTPNGFTSASAENISTRFTPEDWKGKFEAGADYFKPEQKSGANAGSPRRAQSGSRPRGRSPTKVRPIDPKLAQSKSADAENVMESPGGTKFSPEEWSKHFKPQTFAPPTYPIRTPGRKPRGSIAKPTMGTAAVVDDSETPDEKPLFGNKPTSTGATAAFSPAPDAMDVDTPPASHTIPIFEEKDNVNTKRPASTSQPTTPVDAESLKVNFDELNIQDLIKTLQLPTPPKGPDTPPPPTMTETISRSAQEQFFAQFGIYMRDWDLFNNKIMLHFVSRKNQVDGFGPQRWEDDQVMEIYRRGLREDALVTKHWQEAREYHEKVLKECAIVKERVKTRDEMEKILNGDNFERPRKKTH